MRRSSLVLVLLALGLAGALAAAQGMRGGTRIGPGEECPPGATETRPGICQAPEFPPPSIVDYRPRSTLVVAEHKVPRAKYPVVDIHGHAYGLAAPGTIDRMAPQLDALNIRLYVSADNLSGERLAAARAALGASQHGRRFALLAGVDFRNVGPGWAERAVAQLEADIKAGALGVGEVSKGFGLSIRKADGSRLRVDDQALDPLWAAFARLDVPAFIHTAEPQEFFQPLDMKNERWLELALFRERRNNQPGQVTFEELLAERNAVFRRHPKTRFIAAHFGWHANDLVRAARLLDEFPNVTVELGAVLYDFGRQPRAAREFFIKYQDRILFGKDSYQPDEYPYYWRVFETADEYFDYYRPYHAFWKLYGMNLPDEVLKKVYYANALRVLKLPLDGWPR